MGSTPYSIRLDDDLREALEREARAEDRPAAQLAVRAIRDMLAAKAAKREALAAAMAEAEKGVFISSDAVNAWLDSWDSPEELPVPQPDILPSRK